ACPVGFFTVEGSKQCFKYWNDYPRNWEESKFKCMDENLVLASPSDEAAIALRKYILDEYGDRVYLWLDGVVPKGRNPMMWQRNQTELRRDNPLWLRGEPMLCSKHEFLCGDLCLLMPIVQELVTFFPTQVYRTWDCAWYLGATLCEAIDV
ncbi:unnamed protein product, partial [Meganyctiphanes norvegica]